MGFHFLVQESESEVDRIVPDPQHLHGLGLQALCPQRIFQAKVH